MPIIDSEMSKEFNGCTTVTVFCFYFLSVVVLLITFEKLRQVVQYTKILFM